jgi:hypothetical protein
MAAPSALAAAEAEEEAARLITALLSVATEEMVELMAEEVVVAETATMLA